MFYSFNLVLVTFLSWGFAIVIGVFLIINVKIVLSNQTAKEMTEGFQQYEEKLNCQYYNRGTTRENLREALGYDIWWQALIPVPIVERDLSQIIVPNLRKSV